MGTERRYRTCLIAICAGKINQNAVALTPLKPIYDAQTEGSLPKWWNGRHSGLRIRRLKKRGGSNPLLGISNSIIRNSNFNSIKLGKNSPPKNRQKSRG
jgi:hypothetical protein